MRGGEPRIRVQGIGRVAPVEAHGKLHHAEVHDIVGIPDRAVRIPSLIAHRDDVPVPVLLNAEPQGIVPVPHIALAVPGDAVDDVAREGAGLVPFDDKFDEVILRHAVVDVENCREEQH